MDNVLLYFSLKYQGNWESIYNALDKKEKISHDDFVTKSTEINSNFISIINPLYPTSLKNAHKPPFVLFTEGDLNLLSNYHQIIGISGDEKINDYGLMAIESLIKGFKKENRILLIGDEKGVEFTIIEKAIEFKNKIIVITKYGIQDFINKNSKLVSLIRKTNYLIISESYVNSSLSEIDEEQQEYVFRLKAGISKAFVIIQAKLKSKCLKIINYTLNDGKDVFVIPESINSEYKGSNLLIKQGAKLVENSFDILNEM